MSDLDSAFWALIFLFAVIAVFPLWLLLGDWVLRPLERRLIARFGKRQPSQKDDE